MGLHGDFNEIMHAKEKVGGGIRLEGQMRCFIEIINRCRLRDMRYVGSNYTSSENLKIPLWLHFKP